MHSKFKLFLGTSIGLLVVDQLVKEWARNAAQNVEGRAIGTIIPNVIELKLVFNKGVAFGMLEGKGIFLTPIALAITVFTVIYSLKHQKEPKLTHVIMGLLAAGAIGNLIDRVLHQKVTDMFYLRFIDFPVFNVADICITIAGTAFVLVALKDLFSPKPKPEELPTTATSENPTE